MTAPCFDPDACCTVRTRRQTPNPGALLAVTKLACCVPEARASVLEKSQGFDVAIGCHSDDHVEKSRARIEINHRCREEDADSCDFFSFRIPARSPNRLLASQGELSWVLVTLHQKVRSGTPGAPLAVVPSDRFVTRTSSPPSATARSAHGYPSKRDMTNTKATAARSDGIIPTSPQRNGARSMSRADHDCRHCAGTSCRWPCAALTACKSFRRPEAEPLR
jgi:hypothetical protein